MQQLDSVIRSRKGGLMDACSHANATVTMLDLQRSRSPSI